MTLILKKHHIAGLGMKGVSSFTESGIMFVVYRKPYNVRSYLTCVQKNNRIDRQVEYGQTAQLLLILWHFFIHDREPEAYTHGRVRSCLK